VIVDDDILHDLNKRFCKRTSVKGMLVYKISVKEKLP
jgi:hypothetical protein